MGQQPAAKDQGDQQAIPAIILGSLGSPVGLGTLAALAAAEGSSFGVAAVEAY